MSFWLINSSKSSFSAKRIQALCMINALQMQLPIPCHKAARFCKILVFSVLPLMECSSKCRSKSPKSVRELTSKSERTEPELVVALRSNMSIGASNAAVSLKMSAAFLSQEYVISSSKSAVPYITFAFVLIPGFPFPNRNKV